jgi:peroxin-5
VFAVAIKENPEDHSLWNKYGAALSNNLQTKEAIIAYQQALDLRQNYVRTIVNIGLAHNNLTDYKSAANCYMNALVLNPNIKHVWTYLRTSILQMNRMDLLEKCEARDLNLFKDEFMLIDPSQMK